jgi:hypothetical protein
MKRIATTIAVLFVAFAVLDALTAILCRASGLPDRVVDIQHPSTLVAKLDRLRAASHPKVVLLGDSLVYGGILEDFGDADWRDHELGTQLANELGGSTFVMNLGINGALPMDLEALVALVSACDVDWVVFDTHLRPFSADFSEPANQMSRPWLRELQMDSVGRAHWRPSAGDTSRWLTGRLADRSFLVRNRMLVQENLLATSPARKPVLRPTVPLSAQGPAATTRPGSTRPAGRCSGTNAPRAVGPWAEARRVLRQRESCIVAGRDGTGRTRQTKRAARAAGA